MTDLESAREQAYELWTTHKSAAKRLRAFALTCVNNVHFHDILYIVKIEENADKKVPGFFEQRAEVFTTLRESNIASPSMAWPYLSIASEGSLVAARLIVPKLMIWDFRTGKRLN